MEIWINLFFNNGFSCCLIKLNKNWLNYRIQGHLFTSHWITKISIVLCFVQKILTHVKRVVRSGPAFCSCSIFCVKCHLPNIHQFVSREHVALPMQSGTNSFLQIIIKLLSTNYYTNIFKNWLTLFNNAHGNY